MWLAVDKDGEEGIFENKPNRVSGIWNRSNDLDTFIPVPKGTVLRLLDYPLTWDDEAQEIIEYSNSAGSLKSRYELENIINLNTNEINELNDYIDELLGDLAECGLN